MASDLKEVSGGSTAAVLWLMIALVFLPIIGIHLGALWLGDAAQAEIAQSPQDAPPVQLAQPGLSSRP